MGPDAMHGTTMTTMKTTVLFVAALGVSMPAFAQIDRIGLQHRRAMVAPPDQP